MKKQLLALFAAGISFLTIAAQEPDSTYAEKLGFPKGAKVLILHVDDVGMSYDSNEGAIKAMTEGVATSCSMMMPCPWVPHFVHYYKEHPRLDVGLHLTLTSEWKGYRWGPLSGKKATPGLVDPEGALWSSVEAVVQHASAEEVGTEIAAQLDRAKNMGFEPTHMDTHMGTLLAKPDFMQQYIQLGIKNHIPIMIPGGHIKLISEQIHAPEERIQQMRQVGKMLWANGLPVLDDLHNSSYGDHIPQELLGDDRKVQAFKTAQYIKGLRSLHPGVTMMIMHCTATTEVFPHISDSGPVRRGDMLAMTDPALKKAIQDEGIILTTWREIKERRERLK